MTAEEYFLEIVIAFYYLLSKMNFEKYILEKNKLMSM